MFIKNKIKNLNFSIRNINPISSFLSFNQCRFNDFILLYKNYFNLSIILLIFLLFSSQRLLSLPEINRVSVEPLNRATLYFNSIPEKFETELSADKKKVTIRIPNCNVTDNARITPAAGIIQSVYIQSNNKNLEISIILNETRGYSATILPYSKAIMTEVFKWDKLSPGEDLLRCGQLALENEILSTAKAYFKKSFNEGNANAGFYLGLILLREDKKDEALKVLQTAESKGANIPDLWAALAQINKFKKNYNEQTRCEKLFYERSGLTNYEDLKINGIAINDSMYELPALMAGITDTTINMSDSLNKIYHSKDSSNKDKISQNLPLNNTDSTKLKTENSNNGFFGKILTYLIVTAIFIGFFVLSSYVRWKKNKIRVTNLTVKQNPKAGNFSDKLKEASSAIAGGSYFTKIYKNSEGSPQNQTNDNTQVNKPHGANHNSKKDIKLIPNNFTLPKDLNLEKKFGLVTDELSKASDNKNQNQTIKDDNLISDAKNYNNSDNNKKKNIQSDPKIELAKHMRSEEQKMKAQNIESLVPSDIPNDNNSILELAKKLGVDKSSIEAKKSISSLEGDENALEKLKNKFSLKK